MSVTEDLIDFDIIESQKENIQSLPSGRSARTLANLFSPSPLHALSTPTPSDTKNLNDAIRQEYEIELTNISESDDPLDIYDRYVRWTLDAYPSAQATPSSQLLPLLERATKAFLTSPQYKNDPRYLKLWISYIRFFSDTPRETFAFLARHSIGEGLALFYEEFAAWLEGAGRWTQAEEVYKLGIDREALPTPRLLRKYNEFQQRFSQRPEDVNEPSSPALPSVRPALAAKVDPFAAAAPRDPQAPRPNSGVGGSTTTKSGKQKLTIFSDGDDAAPALASGDTKGWESIGGLADPMYHSPEILGSELSLEELRAGHRGWLTKVWEPELVKQENNEPLVAKVQIDETVETITEEVPDKLVILRDPVALDENGVQKESSREGRGRRMKIKEVNETQIIKAKLSSPSGPKMTKRKSSKEQTMTLHTRAATDDIFDLFSQPLKQPEEEEEEDESEDDDGDMTDGDYTSGGESTGTGRLPTTSEAGDDETGTGQLPTTSEAGDDETSEVKSVSEWSEFTARKHIPNLEDEDDDTRVSHFTAADEEGFEAIEVEIPPDTEENDDLLTPASPELPPNKRTMFVPIPPEDYEAPLRPYRDPSQVSQNRLPFMTPIAEKTESSLGVPTVREDKNYFGSKTPSKGNGSRQPPPVEFGSSPFKEIVNGARPVEKIAQPQLGKVLKTNKTTAITAKVQSGGAALAKEIAPKGPIIEDAQCNPIDDYIRSTIFENLQPPLSTYDGFFEYKDETRGRTAEIKKFAKAMSKMSKNASDRTTTNISMPPTLRFPGTDRQYMVKRELGAGAFAPVYLLENVSEDEEQDENTPAIMGKGAFDAYGRKTHEALKMEDPPTAWEFYIMRQAKRRLGVSRASESVINVYEMHLYADECYLIEEYRDQGTLLDVINIARSESTAAGPGVMDESLAMFFTIELFRTIESLHSKGILHGDLKADNCLVRLDALSDTDQTYPRAIKLRSGALLASLTVYDPNNAIQLAVSHDDGTSWAAHGTVLSVSTSDATPTALDNSFLLELPSGRLLCAFRAHTMAREALGAEEKPGGMNEGYLFFRLLVYASEDGGRTWTYLSTAAEEPGPSNGIWEPFLRIGDAGGSGEGELQFYYSREMGGGRDQDNLMRVSRDGGLSWSGARTVSGAGMQTRDGMLGIQEVGGEGSGHLMAVFETVEEKGDGKTFTARFEVWSVMSRDGGASWGERRVIYESWFGEPGDELHLKRNAGAPSIALVGKTLIVSFMTDETKLEGMWTRNAYVKIITSDDGGLTWGNKLIIAEMPAAWSGLLALNDTHFLVMCEHEDRAEARQVALV
ncbi:Checkpoint serine/threonine-protein kinase [Lachnellula willkommii]|uniref:Checkpoint serine/threonine-protein kinase n=1 Tax=Lachnellula willkommii TaxID=215461 RepID=A0A559MBN4_9HELO|nr:Checkpoint serine/threonine-protein kinase [Lachnellula willkommii]